MYENLRDAHTCIYNQTATYQNSTQHPLTDFVGDFATPESRVRSLTRLGVPEDDAHLYAEGVRRGGTLLVGEVTDDSTERALAIIERSSPVDLAERGEHYRTAGWSRYDAGADYTADQAAEERSLYGTGLRSAAAEFRHTNQAPTAGTATRGGGMAGHREVASGEEERIPVVEEQIDIEKQAIERGGVRARTYVRDTPVEQQVTLREEHVHVERRPVDRTADNLPPDAFQDRTIEVRETAEEAVIDKTARVTEEVVIRKDVEERTETVRDTVRRTEVEVEDTRDRVAGRGTDFGPTDTGMGTGMTPDLGDRTGEAAQDVQDDRHDKAGLGDRTREAAPDAAAEVRGYRGTATGNVTRPVTGTHTTADYEASTTNTTTPGLSERTTEAGHDITADMKEDRSLGGRIAEAAHDAKEDLKGNRDPLRETSRKDR
jgi:uncharacterized protein (TIGR02271 family)